MAVQAGTTELGRRVAASRPVWSDLGPSFGTPALGAGLISGVPRLWAPRMLCKTLRVSGASRRCRQASTISMRQPPCAMCAMWRSPLRWPETAAFKPLEHVILFLFWISIDWISIREVEEKGQLGRLPFSPSRPPHRPYPVYFHSQGFPMGHVAHMISDSACPDGIGCNNYKIQPDHKQRGNAGPQGKSASLLSHVHFRQGS